MFALQAILFLLVYAAPLPFGRHQLLDPITMVAIQQLNLTDAWDETSYWAARTLPPIRLPVFVMGCCAAFERLDMAQRTALGLLPFGGWRRNAAVLTVLWLALLLMGERRILHGVHARHQPAKAACAQEPARVCSTRRAAVSCRRGATASGSVQHSQLRVWPLPSPPPRIPKVGVTQMSVGYDHKLPSRRREYPQPPR